ncbi:zinc finger MYND domain-containing protein [Rapidithrix thailandica]|uniref:Zinc finger MYND domain-containing protein n=1 Tax=Rapidithrix thailandica TaxID=413964 RepID=A0AAW9SAA4_9BACT
MAESNPLQSHKRKADMQAFAEIFREKPYWEQYKPKQRIALVLSFVCNALSIAAAFTFPFLQLAELLPYVAEETAYFLSGLITLCLLVLLELGLRLELRYFFVGALKSNWQKINPFSLLWVALLFSLSVFSSMKGAELFVLHTDTQQKVLLDNFQRDTVQINRGFLQRIAEEEKALAAYKASVSWKGKINMYNPTTRQVIAGHTSEIARLKADWRDGLQHAQGRYEQQAVEQKQFTHTAARVMMGVSLSVVSLFLLSMWYIYYFAHRSVLEEQNPQEASRPVPVTVPYEPERERPQIGFQIPVVKKKDAKETAERDAETDKTDGEKTRVTEEERDYDSRRQGFEIICDHCGKTALKQRPNAHFCSDACRMEYWKLKNKKKQ